MSSIISGTAYLSENDVLLRTIIDKVGICDLCKKDEMFRYLIRSIIGQQLSVSAAKSINEKVDNHFNSDFHPQAFAKTSIDQFKKIGVSSRKASYIFDLCHKINSAELILTNLIELDNLQIISQLTQVKGIGTWTAKMFLIFVLARTNVFPMEDLTFKNQLIDLYSINPSEFDKLDQLQKKWHPYESIAAWYLWRHKDLKLAIYRKGNVDSE
jgi:DNA-3-methyladenine glycosylase II